MQRSDVRLSVPSLDSRCGLLLWAGDIDQQWRAGAGRPTATALSSKCGQCHVDSRVNEAELTSW